MNDFYLVDLQYGMKHDRHLKITMEYKFKTVYDGRLIACVPDAGRNLVLGYHTRRDGNTVLLSIGSMYDLPIFQYTGKKDRDGEEIYTGHKIQKDEYVCAVVFDQRYAKYHLSIITPETRNIVNFENEMQIGNYGICRSEEWKIIGHEAIK